MRLLMDDVVESVAPKDRWTSIKRKAKVVAAAIAGLLFVISKRHTKWTGIQAMFVALLLPSPLKDKQLEGPRVLEKLQELKKKLATATAEDEVMLRGQINLLEDILTGK